MSFELYCQKVGDRGNYYKILIHVGEIAPGLPRMFPCSQQQFY